MFEVIGTGRRAPVVRPERRGPAEGDEVIGVDRAPQRRPGVPRAPEEGRDPTLRRSVPAFPTAVFGSAQPRHGASGAVRRAAYRIPEQKARHWIILLLADRLDVWEDRVAGALSRSLPGRRSPGRRSRRATRRARGRSLVTLGVAGAVAWVTWWALRRS